MSVAPSNHSNADINDASTYAVEKKEFDDANNPNLKSYISRIKVSNFAGMVGTPDQNVASNECSEGVYDESIQIDLSPGLVAITGETGSGKSLLLNKAVNLAVGGKANNIIQNKEDNEGDFSKEIRVEMGKLLNYALR